MEAENLLKKVDDETYLTVKLPAVGLKFVNGYSSRYSDEYDASLSGVVSESELKDIIWRLNDTIISYWPCTTCYVCGFVMTPCTLGASLLLPNYCAAQSEQQANKMLRNVSLRAKFYDRSISFRIVKTCCDSYVEIRYPSHLQDSAASPYLDVPGALEMENRDLSLHSNAATAARRAAKDR